MPAGAESLWPGERLGIYDGIPALTHLSRGRHNSLVVFVTGAGHLARVAYGAPAANARDFLDFWLNDAGYSCLAVSHPAEHPVFPEVFPDFTVTQWAELIVSATLDALSETRTAGPVIVVGWSMGGRLVASLNRAAREVGLRIDSFIALSGTPPLPGLLSTPRDDADGLTVNGLWDPFAPRLGWAWQDALDEQGAINGHAVVDVATYREDYCGATPLRLRGGTRTESARFSLDEICADLNSFAYAEYPIVGAIRPLRQSDALHALTDRETWGFLNTQKIVFGWLGDYLSGQVRLAPAQQRELISLMDSVADRLTRSVDGGHLFFLGETGARATARHIVELHDEAEALRKGVASILAIAPDSQAA